MHSQKTSPPTSNARQRDDRPPNPGDLTDDFISRLRAGDDDDLFTEDDAVEAAETERAIENIRQVSAQPSRPAEEVRGVSLPPVLQRIFGTEAEAELMAVAKFLDPHSRQTLTLVFHTPIGDVRTPVNWSSYPPEQIHRAKDLLLILVRTSSSTFIPIPGSDLEISFAEHGGGRLRATCLAPPMRLYPGVGIDLLCFLPHVDASVEKNGQLKDGAPSVVSGNPSTHTDEEGEPLADGEKAASLRQVAESWDHPREYKGLPSRAPGIED